MVYRELDKQALKANSYTVLSKITLLNDGSVFTEDDHIIDWNYEDYRYVPDTGFVGQFVERILDGNLQDIPENKIFENQEINLQIGIVNALDEATTWYDYGNFLITKVEKEDTTGKYKFESADYTKKFNKEYDDTINYPCIVMELANNVCSQAEVELDSADKCYLYITDENGLEAGDYKFKVDNTYYNFSITTALEKNDVLYFVAALNRLILKKVRYNDIDGYVVTRESLPFTTSSTAGSNTSLEMRVTNYVNFTNNDFVIENNQYEEKDTLRKVMQDIGKLAYSWIRVGEDNLVHIDFEQDTTIDSYDELTTDEYYVSKKSDLYFGPVNKVLLGMSNIEGENLYKTSQDYTEETECAIKIYDNNLTYTEELRAIALNGCDKLFGIQYMPLELETIGHPWLNANEMIKLTNVDGEELYTYPFNRTIKYAGYIDGIISSETGTIQESKYEYESEIVKQINKTSIVVDKNSQTITALVSDVSDAQSDITTLEQTTNSLTATVEHLDEEYEQNVVVRRDAEGNPIEVEDAGNYELEDFKIYGGTYQEQTTQNANLFDENYYNNNSLYQNNVYRYVLTRIKGGRTLYVKAVLKSGKTNISGFYACLCSTQQPNISGSKYTWFVQNGAVKSYGFNTTDINDLYFTFYPTTTAVSDIFDTYNFMVSTNNVDYVPFVPDSPSPDYPQEVQTVTSKTTTVDYSGSSIDIDYSYDQGLVKVERDDMSFKGNTTQDGTPTPSTPIPIEVVSGRQEVNVCGKNLAYTGWAENFASRINDNSKAGLTIKDDRNCLWFNSNAGHGSHNTKYLFKPIGNFKENTQYTFQFDIYSAATNGNLSIEYTDGTTTTQTILVNQWNKMTLRSVANKTIKYLRVAWYTGLSYIDLDTFMVVEGTILGDYEPYIGNTYSINLGKNLFDKDNATFKDGYYLNASGAETSNSAYTYMTSYIKVEPNTTYSIQGTLWNVSGGGRIYFFDNSKTWLSRSSSAYSQGSIPITFTTPNNCYYISFQANTSAIDKDTIQIEKGQPTSYAPYFTPIELCKIGNYKDRIFKSSGVNLFKGYNNMETGFLPTSGSYPTTNSSYPNARYQLIELKAGESITTSNSTNSRGRFRYIDKETNQVVGTITNTTNAYFTSTGTYLDGFVSGTITAVKDFIVGVMLIRNEDTQFMINYGTTALPYEPYGTNKWYLYKEIGKYNFTGTETWSKSSGYTTTNTFTCYTNGINPAPKTATNRLGGYYNRGFVNDIAYAYANYSSFFGYNSNAHHMLGIPKSVIPNWDESLTDANKITLFKQYLTNNLCTIIYVLATPTCTEITNEELISQLDTLNNCEFYSNITHYITTSSNLPMISNFSISYLPYKVITISDEDDNSYAFKPLFRNLELCKIGDYTDYLYRKDGKWYKHSEIGKVVLTGDASESWTQATVSGNVYFYINLPNSIDATSVSLNLYSNYFLPYRKSNSKDDFNQYRHNLIVFNHDITDNLSDFRTWLSTHNTIVYYVLETPTETEITDEEIIPELNNLMLQPLYQGYDSIYLNDELCDKLSIRYLTDSMFNDTYATKSQLSVTNENVSALVTRSSLMEDNITNLTLGINNISTEVTSVQNVTADLENSINYLAVDMSGNSIIIPTSSENKPYVSTTYQIPYNATFKGDAVNPTVNTSSASVTGITLSFTTGFINVAVTSTTAIPTATNSFLINFTYTNEGKTYLVSKTLNVALSVEGKDGKDGTSVTILGSYNTLSDLETAHPTGNAGDSYMVGTDLYVWDVSSSSWKDVGQIKGTDGISTYFYVRYSENADGNPMTASPTSSSKYIGVCSTTSNTAPTAYTSYTWSKYLGENGDTTYLHIKYSEDGYNFVPASDDAAEGDTPSAWVGVLTDTNSTASTTFSDYTWYKFTEDIDNQLVDLQNQISQNSTDINNNYTAIIEKLNDYASVDTVAKLTQTVETNQTNTDYAISIIQDLEVNGVSQVRTKKGFTFNDDGMTVDASNSPTKSVTDTGGIQVIDKSGSSNSELLYAGYDETTQTSIVRTENLSVSTYFNIGSKSRFEDYKNGTGVFI